MNTNFVKTCVSPMCDCSVETGTTSHFLLFCHFFANERQKLRDDVHRIDVSIKNLNEGSLIDVLLDSSDKFNDSKNKQILFNTICYIRPNVLKDLLLTSANFCQLLPLCFSLICLLKLYLQCNS